MSLLQNVKRGVHLKCRVVELRKTLYMGKSSKKIICYVLILLIGALVFSSPHKVIAADPDRDIDITKTAQKVTQYAQSDSNWSSEDVNGRSFEECGCILAALATMMSLYLPSNTFDATIPRFPTKLLFGREITFNPVYLLHYLQYGPPKNGDPPIPIDPHETNLEPTDWGLKKVRNSCGVMPKPWAFENVGIPFVSSTGHSTPTGITLKTRDVNGLDATSRRIINQRLTSNPGEPTIVATQYYHEDGKIAKNLFHAYVIVGWDNENKTYLVLDPMLNPNDKWEVNTGPHAPKSNRTNSYKGWLGDIRVVITAKTAFGGFQKKEMLHDDPAPIEFAVTDPNGMRSGYNSLTQEFDYNSSNSFPYHFGEEMDILGTATEGHMAKGLEIDDPKDGDVYRVEIIGTGDGNYKIDQESIRGGPIHRRTFEGTIQTGQVLKYQMAYFNSSAPIVHEVDNFIPVAVPGDDRSTRAGRDVIFDGKRSWDADGTISSWVWDFGDGSNASGNRVTHKYAAEGEYTVTLEVKDNQGTAGTKTLTVSVTKPPTINVGRVSISTEAVQGNNSSGMTLNSLGWTDYLPLPWIETVSLSEDGRYTAFQSIASNLVAGDTNQVTDVFVHDRETNTTERVSLSPSGDQLSAPSGIPRISADGRYVVFYSGGNVFVRERSSDTTETMNVHTNGNSVSGQRVIPGGISRNGQYVVFSTEASLVAEDTNGLQSVYLRDVVQGKTEWVSKSAEFNPYGAWDPVMSDDANKIVFTNQSSSDSAGSQLYLFNRSDNTSEIISTTQAGTRGGSASQHPDITPDGKLLTFVNRDLAGNTGTYRVVIKDLQTGNVQGVLGSTNVDNGGLKSRPRFSADGRNILIQVPSRIPNGSNNSNTFEIHGFAVFDREAGTIRRVDLTQAGGLPNHAGSPYAALSGDGNWVAFSSYASTIVPFDTNGQPDVFLRDMRTAVPPVADISGPYIGWTTTTNSSRTVAFDGSLSFDTSGAPLTAMWDYGDGSAKQTTTNLKPSHAYSKEGTFKATLTVTNGGETSASASATVTIHPSSETDISVSPPCSDPGSRFLVSGITAPPQSVRNGWDLANGPLPDNSFSLFTDWNQRIDIKAKAPLYAFNAPFTAPPLITGTRRISGTYVFEIPCPKPNNLNPISDAGGPYKTTVGSPVVLDGSDSVDPEGANLTYSWKFGDDTAGTGENPSHTYQKAGKYFVGLVVKDGVNSSIITPGKGFTYVTVEENAAITIKTDKAEVEGNEGSTVTNTGTYTNPSQKSITFSTSIGSVQDLGDGKWKWSYMPADGPQVDSVTVTATGESNTTAKTTFELSVKNVAPSITALAIGGVGTACREGNNVPVTIELKDPANANDPLTSIIDWGDGTSNTSFTGDTFSNTHNYKPGTYNLIIKVSDDDGATTTNIAQPERVVLLFTPGNILEPINPDGSSTFKIGSTIPVKVRVADCHEDTISNLIPTVNLVAIGSTETTVNEIASSSEADSGNQMRWGGSHYMFNLSTKNSQFNQNNDLTQGRYRLTVKDPLMAPLNAEINLR